MKNTLDGIKRLDVTKENIIELKYIVMENIQNEIKQRDEQNEQRISKQWDNVKKFQLCVFLEPSKETKR